MKGSFTRALMGLTKLKMQYLWLQKATTLHKQFPNVTNILYTVCGYYSGQSWL